VIKKVAPVSALLLAFALLASPASMLHAQSASPSKTAVVTGGDPEPPGEPAVVTGGDPEPPGEPSIITAFTMAALISLGLA